MAKDKKTILPKRPDPPRIKFDLEKYQALLDGEDVSEADKQELLQTLWNIITEFVSLGFGVHPVQQACGQVKNWDAAPAIEAASELYLDHTIISEDFLSAAKREHNEPV